MSEIVQGQSLCFRLGFWTQRIVRRYIRVVFVDPDHPTFSSILNTGKSILEGVTDWVISSQSYCYFFPVVLNCDVCSRTELNADVVLSGGTDIPFQSVMNCQPCIRKSCTPNVVLSAARPCAKGFLSL